MKRIGLVVLGVALSAAGCELTTFFRDEQKPPPVEMKAPAPPPTVLPEGITEKNAAERAAQLRAELEYEQKHSLRATAAQE
jgi:hypothetical protein